MIYGLVIALTAIYFLIGAGVAYWLRRDWWIQILGVTCWPAFLGLLAVTFWDEANDELRELDE